MIEILQFSRYLLYLYGIIVFASVLLSLLAHFNIINPFQPFVRSVMLGLNAVTEPVLRPIRRFLPRSSGLDFSPIVLFVALYFVRDFLIGECGFGIIMRQLCG